MLPVLRRTFELGVSSQQQKRGGQTFPPHMRASKTGVYPLPNTEIFFGGAAHRLIILELAKGFEPPTL